MSVFCGFNAAPSKYCLTNFASWPSKSVGSKSLNCNVTVVLCRTCSSVGQRTEAPATPGSPCGTDCRLNSVIPANILQLYVLLKQARDVPGS